ncbi:MAG: YfcE family phosphodiesterase [Lachnospiraceae bacterium]|nr:YfcE family phosphodiesterase [Lachnospiraceae bacterium]
MSEEVTKAALAAKRVVIVSDTHGHREVLSQLMDKIETPDLLIHCGDLECDREQVRKIAGCPLVCVRGNCDYVSDLPGEAEITIGKYKTWILHGHRMGVSVTPVILMEEALARGIDIVMFGHTHQPLIQFYQGLTALNPGSLVYPRQEGRRASYLTMEIDDAGEAHYNICYL